MERKETIQSFQHEMQWRNWSIKSKIWSDQEAVNIKDGSHPETETIRDWEWWTDVCLLLGKGQKGDRLVLSLLSGDSGMQHLEEMAS